MANAPTVDPRVTDAVIRANQVLEEGALRSASAIVFMEVAQSMALAVQSGVAQLQSTFTLNVATTGAAFAQALSSAAADPKQTQQRLQGILEDSQSTVQTAMENLAILTAQAAKALEELPSSAGPGPSPGPLSSKKK